MNRMPVQTESWSALREASHCAAASPVGSDECWPRSDMHVCAHAVHTHRPPYRITARRASRPPPTAATASTASPSSLSPSSEPALWEGMQGATVLSEVILNWCALTSSIASSRASRESSLF